MGDWATLESKSDWWRPPGVVHRAAFQERILASIPAGSTAVSPRRSIGRARPPTTPSPHADHSSAAAVAGALSDARRSHRAELAAAVELALKEAAADAELRQRDAVEQAEVAAAERQSQAVAMVKEGVNAAMAGAAAAAAAGAESRLTAALAQAQQEKETAVAEAVAQAQQEKETAVAEAVAQAQQEKETAVAEAVAAATPAMKMVDDFAKPEPEPEPEPTVDELSGLRVWPPQPVPLRRKPASARARRHVCRSTPPERRGHLLGAGAEGADLAAGKQGSDPTEAAEESKDRYTDTILNTFTDTCTNATTNLGTVVPGHTGTEAGSLTIIGDPDPNDINQGSMGDCWLLAAFSGFAEYEGSIAKLFRKSATADGGSEVAAPSSPGQPMNLYTVSLWNQSCAGSTCTWAPVDIVVDERLATSGPDSKSPCYARPSAEGELWPCYLEKACAAMLGGYSAIGNGGYTARGWQLLTGCPDTTTVTLDANSEAKQIEAFTTLCQYDDANYLMGTHTRGGGTDKDKRADGLVDRHAYTVLECHQNVAGTAVDLVKLRNPWGTGELTSGQWDDDGPGWEEYPAVREAIQPVQADDGAFWMSRQELCQQMSDVTCVCIDMEVWVKGFDTVHSVIATGLRRTAKGLGTDEEYLAGILLALTNNEGPGNPTIQAVDAAFAHEYGVTLRAMITSETSGDYRRFLLNMMTPKAELDAAAFDKATTGRLLGNDDDLLIELVCTRSDTDLLAARKMYEKLYGKDLLETITTSTKGDYQKLLLMVFERGQEKDPEASKNLAEIAEDLHNAMEGWGTEEAFLMTTVCEMHPSMWAADQVPKVYAEKYGRALIDDIKSETSGKFRRLLGMRMRPDCWDVWAELLHDAGAGLGTDEATIVRVLSCCQVDGKSYVDCLAKLAHVYESKYAVQEKKSPLRAMLASELSGGMLRIVECLLPADLQSGGKRPVFSPQEAAAE